MREANKTCKCKAARCHCVRQAELRGRGLCMYCGKASPDSGRASCRQCRRMHTIKMNEGRAVARAKGLCGLCRKEPSAPNRLCGEACLAAARVRSAAARARRRQPEEVTPPPLGEATLEAKGVQS